MANWPEEWKFAAIVRDAITHDGRVKMKKDIHEVYWRGLNYTSEDEERNRLITDDISGGDLLALILDMEPYLERTSGDKLFAMGWCSKEEAEFWSLTRDCFVGSNCCDFAPKNVLRRMVRS